MLLVLLSGAGLLAFALVDLWGAVREADVVARREAVRKAESIADRLTRLLASPAVMESVPVAYRFEIRDGEVVVPPEIGWLERPPEPFAEVDLPDIAGPKLQAARRAEVIDRDPTTAEALLAEAMAAEGLSDRGRAHLLTEAAWQAVRFGREDRADRLWRELSDLPVLGPRVVGAAILLGRRLHGDDPPSESWARLQSLAGVLPDDERERVVGPMPSVSHRRAMLRAVAAMPEVRHGARVRGLKSSGVDTADGTLLLYDQREGGQRGALIATPALLAWLGRDADRDPSWGAIPDIDWDEEWAAQLRDSGSKDAVPVLESLVVEPIVTPAPFWASPIVLVVLLVVTAICFGAGLFFSFRALLRESAAMRSRADFLTSVTHELKTPLSSIRLLSEMLQEGRVRGDEKKGEYYRLLAGESARLTVLIENVLDLGRMERGERAYDLRPVAVDQVVEQAIRVFAPIASRDGLRVTVDLDAKNRRANVDRGAFVQALLNVLDNARKYAMAGGSLQVNSRVDRGRYRLSVRDHGPGIRAEDRRRIFERFGRGTEQKQGSIAGVGLGLYLARTILRAHDGELSCESPRDGGAEFVFSLPLPEPTLAADVDHPKAEDQTRNGREETTTDRRG